MASLVINNEIFDLNYYAFKPSDTGVIVECKLKKLIEINMNLDDVYIIDDDFLNFKHFKNVGIFTENDSLFFEYSYYMNCDKNILRNFKFKKLYDKFNNR